jgi:hypothetical protein
LTLQINPDYFTCIEKRIMAKRKDAEFQRLVENDAD